MYWGVVKCACVCLCVCVLQIKNRLHEAFGDAGTRELTEEQVWDRVARPWPFDTAPA